MDSGSQGLAAGYDPYPGTKAIRVPIDKLCFHLPIAFPIVRNPVIVSSYWVPRKTSFASFSRYPAGLVYWGRGLTINGLRYS